MVSAFVKEQKRYSQEDLCRIFKCSQEKVVFFIRKLKEFNILKTVKATDEQKDMSDLVEEDIEVADVEVGENRYWYVFTFVGVIVISGCVLKCYPKYLPCEIRAVDELRQVLKVLEKYNSKEQIIRLFNDSSESNEFNLLAVLLYLLQDYYENDVYSNMEDVIESNGAGEILWDKTINDTFAMFINNRPYYIDIQTKKNVSDEYDYFKRLHEYALTTASEELKDAGLLDLFEITEINLSEEQIDDFGETDYILYQIEKELNIQFNTRKQLVLKTIYAYIKQGGSLVDTNCLSLFGTNSFNLVWEKICANILDNQLKVHLGALHMPKALQSGYDSDKELIDIIEKPLWTKTGKRAKDTLKPDIIVINGTRFIIFDAKYYNACLAKGEVPKGQPEIESITKQYLYQLAYNDFIKEHGFSGVENCFLLPTDAEKIIDGGKVSMQMFAPCELQDIKVRFLPAKMVYENYLNDRIMDVSDILQCKDILTDSR